MSRRRAIGLLAGLTVAAQVGRPAMVAAAAPVPVADGLQIMPRAAWADGREPTGPLNAEDVRFLLVHHTASPNGLDPIQSMRSSYSFHTGPEKGWPDVAYNFFIDHNGVVWEGRTGSLAGPVEASATGGSQGFAQLVCVMGDFTSELPTDAALASLTRTLAWLATRYNIPTAPGSTTQFVSRGSNRWPEGTTVTAATISGHRDMSRTACPGDTFYPYLVANVPAAVTALAAPATTVPTTTTPPTTTTAPTTVAPATSSPGVPTTVPASPSPTALPATTESLTAQSPTAVAPTSTVPGDGSGRDLAVPSLVVLGAAAAGAAALLARRRTSIDHLDHPDDDTTGASP